MSTESRTTTLRAVTATRIPSGEPHEIPEGVEVVITQALGGSLTILVPSEAGLFRVESKDADALGREVETAQKAAAAGGLEEAIWGELKTCFDPEIPVNIVDLGLIYSMVAKPLEAGGHSVNVQMTLTAPGCGMGPVIADEAKRKILGIEGVTDASVEVVWEPAWSPDRISPEGRQKLGIE
ncbi:MAG: putative Fe-S cluster assembly protein SufT [Terrimicrobiaceae bacterium]